MSVLAYLLGAVAFFIAVQKAAQALNRCTESNLVSILSVLGALFLTWPLILILTTLGEGDPEANEVRQVLGFCAAISATILFIRNLKIARSFKVATIGLLLQAILAIVALPGVLLIGFGINFLVS